ncbi:MAG: TerB N-terminal domain-containing protein [Clostridia bacterium]|nr:TerB N-terminal domain-containing protein [Clostridia bacterium]
MSDPKKTGDDRDDFWDISSFVPGKDKKNVSAVYDTSTVGIDIPAGGRKAPGSGSRKIPPRQEHAGSKPETVKSYEPDNPFIVKAEIKLWNTGYKYYAGFYDDVIKYKDAAGKECEPRRFFSYVPQYSQMTAGQLDWYFYWRSLVRKGEYPDTDVSYILLYVYELINLARVITPETSLRLMCLVWRAYRERYYLLDKYLCEWVCDICLLYELEPPYDIITPFLGPTASKAKLPKFYVACVDIGTARLLHYSNYNFRSSRYYNEKTSAVFEKYIPAAVRYAAEHADPELFGFLKADPVEKTVSRDAFEGSLCAYNIKRRIDLRVLEYTECLGARNAILLGNMQKLAENNVRKLIGVKSRMTVKDVDPSVKNAINEFFAPLFRRAADRKKADKKKAETPEYEKYYEAPDTGFSADDAMEIERSSWDVTEILTEYSEDDVVEEAVEEAHSGDDNCGAVKEALRLLIDGDSEGFERLAAEKCMMPDALAEKVCAALYDTVGDSVVEYDDGYKLIEDYIPEINGFLSGN